MDMKFYHFGLVFCTGDAPHPEYTNTLPYKSAILFFGGLTKMYMCIILIVQLPIAILSERE